VDCPQPFYTPIDNNTAWERNPTLCHPEQSDSRLRVRIAMTYLLCHNQGSGWAPFYARFWRRVGYHASPTPLFIRSVAEGSAVRLHPKRRPYK
jgi:hypothetical protein